MIAAIYALLIFLSAVAIAPPAEAECAWVMWMQIVNVAVATAPPAQQDMSKLLIWEPHAAHETKKSCEDVLATEQRRLRETGDEPKLVCLPDTIDPRGPKGTR